MRRRRRYGKAAQVHAPTPTSTGGAMEDRQDQRQGGDFAEGEETLPRDDQVGSFAEGEETQPRDEHVGSFAEGEETLPEDESIGSFADTDEESD
jgi:hypothetical protein